MSSSESDEFTAVVDGFLATNPLACSGASLAPESIRFAAAKLLLRQRLLARNCRIEDSSWPGLGAANLAAIMLVLFVKEVLASNQRSVFGIPQEDFYELILQIIQQRGVSREDFVAALCEVDQDRCATGVANSPELLNLWPVGESVRTASSVESVQPALQAEAQGWGRPSMSTDDSLVPEFAHDLQESLAAQVGLVKPAVSILRQKLSARSLRFRMACAAVSVMWFLACEFIAVTRLYGKESAQVVLHASTVVFGTSVAAASFPLDLASQKRFTLMPSCITALSVLAATTLEFFHRSEAHVNGFCKLVHAALCVMVVAAWSSAAVLSYQGAYTWNLARAVNCVEGGAFLLANTGLRYLGPPPSYPPGNVSFGIGVLRGIVPLTWSAMLTPAFRRRIAEFATSHLGWNHVIISLNEVKDPSMKRR
jgi:hypothetical protein